MKINPTVRTVGHLKKNPAQIMFSMERYMTSSHEYILLPLIWYDLSIVEPLWEHFICLHLLIMAAGESLRFV